MPPARSETGASRLDTTVTIPLSSFPTDINLDLVDDTLVSVVLRVKGLAPPGKREFNQHNAFSGTVTCVVSAAEVLRLEEEKHEVERRLAFVQRELEQTRAKLPRGMSTS